MSDTPDSLDEPAADPGDAGGSGAAADPGGAGDGPRPGPAPASIVVHWRPGCGFCSMLFRGLERHGVPHERVDIWADPEAAARVRAVARGNETVPTVFVGEVPLVNPSVHAVLTLAARVAPHAVPEGYEPPQPGRVSRWISSMLGDGDRRTGDGDPTSDPAPTGDRAPTGDPDEAGTA